MKIGVSISQFKAALYTSNFDFLIFEFIEKDEQKSIKYHYVILDFLAEYAGGELHASSDISDTRWVHLSDLDRMGCNASIKKLVKKVFE